MTDPRLFEGHMFRRKTADQAMISVIDGWEVWTCDDPEFRYDYDRTVVLYVHHGAAMIEFADGTRADLLPGDTMTIRKGASAIWKISKPIRNSYRYLDEH